MTPPRRPLLRRLKLRYVLFLALLLPGILPLVISSVLLITNNQEIFQNAERDYLTQKAGALSRQMDEFLGYHRRQLAQLGRGVLAPAGPAAPPARLREPWIDAYVKQFLIDARDLVALQIVDGSGQGPGALPGRGLLQGERQALEAATALARRGEPAYRFATGPAGEPTAAVAVPASAPGKGMLVTRALIRLRPIQEAFDSEPRREVGIFLIDGRGTLLWRDGNQQVIESLLGSNLVRQFIQKPFSSVQDDEVEVGGRRIPVVVQISAIGESGWGLVVEKPLSIAFATVDRMVFNTVLSTLLLVGLAFLFAFAAARRREPADPAPGRHHPRDRGRQLRPPGRDRRPGLRAVRAGRGLQPDERPPRRATSSSCARRRRRTASCSSARCAPSWRRSTPRIPTPAAIPSGWRRSAAPSPASSPCPRRSSTRCGSAPCSTTSARSASRTAS